MSFCAWSRSEVFRDHFEPGIYVCAKCDNELFGSDRIYVCSKCDYPLFSSHAKYEHQTPWPAFTTPLRPDSLSKKPELEHQESSQCTALKVSCGKCGNPLGHEFIGDGPDKKGSRF